MFFIQSICQCSSCRFIYNSANIQSCNFSGFFSSLTLRIIKICWHCYNGFCYFSSEIIFSNFLHFLKHHCRDFLRRILPAININTNGIIVTFHYFIAPMTDLFCYFVITTAHKAFYAANGIMRIGNSLTFCRITHFTFAIL